jgi:hypothetical protein
MRTSKVFVLGTIGQSEWIPLDDRPNEQAGCRRLIGSGSQRPLGPQVSPRKQRGRSWRGQ